MADSTLKSFLVKIGFKVDEQGAKNFQEAIVKTSKTAEALAKNVVGVSVGYKNNQEASKNFQEAITKTGKIALDLTKIFAGLGVATLASGTAMATAVIAAADPLEDLYFSAQRVGGGVKGVAKELEVFSYAAEKVGIKSAQARAQVEALAYARKTNQGLDGVLATWGITTTDNVKALTQIIAHLRGMQPQLQAMYAQQLFHLDPQTIMQIEQQGPEFLKGLKQGQNLYANTDVDALALKAHETENAFRKLQTTVTVSVEQIVLDLVGKWGPRAKELEQWIQHINTATDGWSNKILGWAAAIGVLTLAIGTLLKMSGLAPLLGFIFKVGSKALGAGVAAAGAGEAAVATTAAEAGTGLVVGGSTLAEGGMLASSALPVILPIVLGAVAAAWGLKALDDKYGTGIRQSLGLTDDVSENQRRVSHGISHGLDKALYIGKGIKNEFDGSDIKKWIAGFEGFRGRVYRDLGGKGTVGYGHLVQPGEDFSGGVDQVLGQRLLASDLAKAADAVRDLVKVHLNKNQEAAMDDLVFNIGKKKFAHSPLLNQLNAGHFDAVAEQLGHYNKVLMHGSYVVSEALAARRASEAKAFRMPDKSVVIHQKTDYHIEGGNAPAIGRETARHQKSINADLTRNFATVVQ
jgi:lysozyme